MGISEAERTIGPLVVGAIDTFEPRAVTRALLEAGALGGVTLFKRNLDGDLPALARRNGALHALSPRGIVVAVDQEGGRVARLRHAPIIQMPAARELAEYCSTKTLEALGYEVGGQLAALGFTMNFAPVLDVHSEERNPVIGDRSFGSAPERAAESALAFAAGQRRAGLGSCGKHFPGHGDTTTDSHLELPYVSASRAVLEEREFSPFRVAASQGLDAFMSAHVVYRALDARPATLAPSIATDLLRRKMGFAGVLFSDDLRMKALQGSAEDNAVQAIAAGCDAVLVCEGEDLVRSVVAKVAEEYAASESFRARCHEARSRVDALVQRFPARTLVDEAALDGVLQATNGRAVRVMAGLDP
jgi:beta-N-acetylhexosaminidase